MPKKTTGHRDTFDGTLDSQPVSDLMGRQIEQISRGQVPPELRNCLRKCDVDPRGRRHVPIEQLDEGD
jgi:hypothetical protein